ncbi:MAG: PQQ-dependent sugar dehydrogenase, partial [Candidatus Limnocylindria bacterium]
MSLVRAVAVMLCGALALPLVLVPPVAAVPVDPDFVDAPVLSGFTNPTAVEFASDGRVFVAEKSGIIKIFDSLADQTPTTFADLRTNVHNFWDRGFLGMALHPGFPADPRLYVLYTHDAVIGGTAPRWGSPGVTSDPCPTPPGALGDGCVVSGRLSVLTASGNVSTGETVLIEDWCQQYPSHSIGDLRFGADGALYVSGGDGASFSFTDYGQDGNPVNPCGDPPGGVGGSMTVPTAQGGALRAQDLLTSGDPVTLDGALLRLDPDTGAAMAGNPLIGSPDLNARRIVAHGFRNPFRFTVRPGTNEVWVGDVGWGGREEINRIDNPTAPITNRGWPCIEGPTDHPGSYADLTMCQDLYTAGTATPPYFSYRHGLPVAGETCSTGAGSSLSGLAFYAGGVYPDTFDGALFFADYSRNCIWVMYAGANGLPDPATVEPFIEAAAGPVQLKIGPGGDLFYPDFNGGTIRRVTYAPPNGTPTAVAAATPTSGTAPLTVDFDGTGSTDPDDDPLTYAWDLDGDGAFDDSSSATPSFTYTQPDSYTVGLRVSDPGGLSDADQLTIDVVASTSTVYLSDLPFVSSTNGWGPVERDRSNGETGATDGGTLTL